MATIARPQKAKHQARIIFLCVALLAAFYALFIFTDLSDVLSNITYTPPAEVSALADKLSLTGKARTIFYATRPALEGRDDFNHHCDSHNADISVLGCYTGGQIYLYNVNSTELPDVVESTAAHELLHAAWERLNVFEKAAVSAELERLYEANQDSLSEDLDLYAPEDRLDELHSRIGTEIADLPASLEHHYAKYFTDQDAIVALYTHYHEPFEQLKAELSTLATELESARAEIDARTKAYYEDVAALNSRIDEFNQCASTVGCFATQADFNTRRRALVSEQSALEDAYHSINTAITEYNNKVTRYNDNILRSETLENLINSNAAPQEVN